MRYVFSILLLLVACRDTVRLQVKVGVADAGARTSTTAAP